MNEEANQQIQWLVWALCAALVINGVLLVTVIVRRYKGDQPTFAPRWSVADLWFGVQAIVALLFVVLVPLLMVAVFAGNLKQGDLTDYTSPRMILSLLLPSAVVQNVVFFGVPAAFINLKYRLPLRSIGLPPLPRRREVIAGLALGVLGMFLSLLIELAVTTIAGHFSDVAWVKAAINIDKNNPVAGMTKVLPHLGAAGLFWGVLGVGIAAPLGEEMLFRGFAFNSLKRRFGLTAGLVLSALLFTLPHSYGLGLFPVFTLGLLLAWTYHNSGSLWVPIIIHATNNTVQIMLAFFFPQLAP